MLQVSRPCDIHQHGHRQGMGPAFQERSVLQVAKLERQRDLSTLASDIELQNLEFALVGISLDLVQYNLSMTDSSLLEW